MNFENNRKLFPAWLSNVKYAPYKRIIILRLLASAYRSRLPRTHYTEPLFGRDDL